MRTNGEMRDGVPDEQLIVKMFIGASWTRPRLRPRRAVKCSVSPRSGRASFALHAAVHLVMSCACLDVLAWLYIVCCTAFVPFVLCTFRTLS